MFGMADHRAQTLFRCFAVRVLSRKSEPAILSDFYCRVDVIVKLDP